jgi:hypothetical protein
MRTCVKYQARWTLPLVGGTMFAVLATLTDAGGRHRLG